MLDEAVSALRPAARGLFVDCTFGRGGHSRELLRRLGTEARVLGLDADPEAVEHGEQLAVEDARFTMRHGAFSGLGEIVEEVFAGAPVNGVLFDLGVSSPQVDEARRGFSFRSDGPLDMRMDPSRGVNAAEWLGQVSEQELTRVLRDYGEERYARRIARAIVAEGVRGPVDTTMKLANIIHHAMPARERGKNPATRSFQAIRIYINDELNELAQALREATRVLVAQGRLAVISFHSLEDRLVKRYVRSEQRPDTGPFAVPVPASAPRLRAVGKPVRAGAVECEANPRARSATLRVAERLA